MKKRLVLLISLVLVGLVFMFLSCRPRSTNHIPVAIETSIEQLIPTPDESTEPRAKDDIALNVENVAVVDGIIVGEVYFNDIPISRFFKEPFVDILGEPLSVRGPHFEYNYLRISGQFNHDREMFDIIQSMHIPALHMVRVNNILLEDQRREDIVSLLGNPIERYEYLDWIYYSHFDESQMRYHIVSPTIVYLLELSFEGGDELRLVTIRTYGF